MNKKQTVEYVIQIVLSLDRALFYPLSAPKAIDNGVSYGTG